MKRRSITIGIVSVLCLVLILIPLVAFFGAIERPQTAQAKTEQFTVPLNAQESDVIQKLYDQGFIKHTWAFDLVLWLRGLHGHIEPGGYNISKSMTAWEIISVLKYKQSLVWVIIPEGVRKEEIADLMVKNLGWTSDQVKEWNTVDTTKNPDYFEGVYFPDTYLIAKTDEPLALAQRLQAAFNDKFTPLAPEARKQNIKWTTVVTLASIVQREAAGKDDMPLIAGILWNRLTQNMRLDVDATVQYARGNTGKGWWAPITVQDKKIDSPYNTYLHNGLPPHPISNPGLDALTAVVNPATTTCLYYIHDNNRKIHCATTYTQQLQNIDTYLR